MVNGVLALVGLLLNIFGIYLFVTKDYNVALGICEAVILLATVGALTRLGSLGKKSRKYRGGQE